MSNLLKKVLKNISENKLLTPGDTVIVAVSGGADSMALLDILSHIEALRLDLVVAHLDHMLRGRDSEADAVFVRDAALRYGLRFELRSIDIKRFSRENKLSLEEGGRKARYSWFDEIAGKYGARTIALGHHADDQAETVLMRLLRGAGTTGLAGISPGSGSRYIRPLLSCTRVEIEDYLKQRSLPFRTDASNSDTRFLRNRIRHELIPELETYNPSVRDRLASTAELLSDDEELLESVTDHAFKNMAETVDDKVVIDIRSLRTKHRALRFRIYRRAIRIVKGNLDHITLKHLQEIDHIALSEKANSHARFPMQLIAAKNYDLLTFSRFGAHAVSETFEIIIQGPGTYHLPGKRLLLLSKADVPACLGDASPFKIFLDPQSLPFPWIARTYRDGDRFTPFGMNGRKKIKDFFIDTKIPLHSRRSIPLITVNGKIVWIAGMRLAEEARIKASAKSLIVVELVE